jgi:hypothetical protein
MLARGMFTELQQQYAKLNDGELLRLACERSSLTDEARVALDAEMRGRNLTAVDIKTHARVVKKSELRETRRRSRKLFGTRVPQMSGVEILVGLFCVAVAISLILLGYFELPARYRLPADWQEPALCTMFNSVLLAVWLFRDWGRRLGFWISLLISSTAQALIVHAWTVRVGTDMLLRHRGAGKAAVLLGIILFFAVYGGGALLRRKFYGLKGTA